MSEDEIIDSLILNGGLEFAGVDTETGEFLYRPTDILKSIDPKQGEIMSVYFSATTMNRGIIDVIDMDVTVADPLVKLAEKAFDINAINSLTKDERVVIQQIIRVLSEKK